MDRHHHGATSLHGNVEPLPPHHRHRQPDGHPRLRIRLPSPTRSHAMDHSIRQGHWLHHYCHPPRNRQNRNRHRTPARQTRDQKRAIRETAAHPRRITLRWRRQRQWAHNPGRGAHRSPQTENRAIQPRRHPIRKTTSLPRIHILRTTRRKTTMEHDTRT